MPYGQGPYAGVIHAGVAVAITPLSVTVSSALGLVLKTTPVPEVELSPVAVGWAIGLSRPGKVVIFPNEPPVPSLSPGDLIGAWEWNDAIHGVTTQIEPVDASFSDASP